MVDWLLRMVCALMAVVLAGTPTLAAVCDATCSTAHALPATPPAEAAAAGASADAAHFHHHAGHHGAATEADATVAPAHEGAARATAVLAEPPASDCPTDSPAATWITATKVDPDAQLALRSADASPAALVRPLGGGFPWHRETPRASPTGARAPNPLRI